MRPGKYEKLKKILQDDRRSPVLCYVRKKGLSESEIQKIIDEFTEADVIWLYKRKYPIKDISNTLLMRRSDVIRILIKNGFEIEKPKYKNLIQERVKIPGYWDKKNIITKALGGY